MVEVYCIFSEAMAFVSLKLFYPTHPHHVAGKSAYVTIDDILTTIIITMMA